MKTWRDKLERMFMAVTYAEADEHQTAMSLAGIQARRPGRRWAIFEKTFSAAAFAEADCSDWALDFLGTDDSPKAKPSLEDFLHNVGLCGVKVRYGMVTVG